MSTTAATMSIPTANARAIRLRPLLYAVAAVIGITLAFALGRITSAATATTVTEPTEPTYASTTTNPTKTTATDKDTLTTTTKTVNDGAVVAITAGPEGSEPEKTPKDKDGLVGTTTADDEKDEEAEGFGDEKLDLLYVTEEQAKADGGIYIRRDGKLITLGRSRPKYEVVSEQNVNIGTASLEPGRIDLYGMSVSDHKDILSFGDVEPPILGPNDEIVGYSRENTPQLILKRYSFVGFALPTTVGSGGDYRITVLGGEYWMTNVVNHKYTASVTIVDSDGDEVKDDHNLTQGEEYVISWYVGTEYHETLREAWCRYYGLADEYFVDPIDGIPTKNGYAVYTLPDLQPGYYTLCDWGIVKIE